MMIELPDNAPLASGERAAAAIVFYDGVCGFCNSSVRFIAARDTRAQFRFASLQGELAAAVLRGYGRDVAALDTMYLLLDRGRPGERLLFNADAILTVLEMLGGVWRRLSGAARLLPRPWRDAVYCGIVRHRYRLFGRYDQCPLPPAALRERFLDGPDPDPQR